MRTPLNIVVHAAMLEKELVIAPESGYLVGTGYNPASEALLTTNFRRLVVGNDLEHDGVHRDSIHLVLEVVFIIVAPAVHIVGFNVDLVRPVGILLRDAILIKIGQVHDRGSTGVISDTREVLADCLAGALVVGLTKDGRPPVLEEVEGRLSVKGEHGEPVCRVHTVAEEFDSMAGNGLAYVRN